MDLSFLRGQLFDIAFQTLLFSVVGYFLIFSRGMAILGWKGIIANGAAVILSILLMGFSMFIITLVERGEVSLRTLLLFLAIFFITALGAWKASRWVLDYFHIPGAEIVSLLFGILVLLLLLVVFFPYYIADFFENPRLG